MPEDEFAQYKASSPKASGRDEFDQYKASPPSKGGDEFSQYKTTEPVGPASATPTGISPLGRESVRGIGYKALATMGANPAVLDKLESFSSYLPSSDAVISAGAPAEGVASGAMAFGKRALGVAGGLAAGLGVHEGAKRLGEAAGFPQVGAILGDVLGLAAGNLVAKNISPEAAAHVEMLFKTKGLGAVRAWLKEVVSPGTGAKAAKPGVKSPFGYSGTPTPYTEPYVPTNTAEPPPTTLGVGGPSNEFGFPSVRVSPIPTTPVKQPPVASPFGYSGATDAGAPYKAPPEIIYTPQGRQYPSGSSAYSEDGPFGAVPTRPRPSSNSPSPAARGTEENPVMGVSTTSTSPSAPPSTTEQEPPFPPGHMAFLNQETTGLGIPQKINAQIAVASGLAAELKKGKITGDQVQALKDLRTSNPDAYSLFWSLAGKYATQKGISKQANYTPSQDTIDRVINILSTNYKLKDIPKR